MPARIGVAPPQVIERFGAVTRHRDLVQHAIGLQRRQRQLDIVRIVFSQQDVSQTRHRESPALSFGSEM